MKPHHLRDLIECSMLDERPPVKLRGRDDFDEFSEFFAPKTNEVVLVKPMCRICGTREAAMKKLHAEPTYFTCGESDCITAMRLRRGRDRPRTGRVMS
jgi:hypothetical protein